LLASNTQIAWLNLKHVTEERLDKANVKVINAYNQFALRKYWGSGKRASADGTKWSLYEQNLLSEFHVRYGGYGGIGYYRVSDMVRTSSPTRSTAIRKHRASRCSASHMCWAST
jgi:TnpA family transposase